MAPAPRPTRLDEALARIDSLIEALKAGALGSSGSSSSSGPTKPAAPPTAAAAAPAAAAAAAPAGGQQGAKQKAKQKKAAAAAAGGVAAGGAAGSEDAFSKAHLAVGRVVSVADHPSGSEKLWLCQVDVGGGAQKQVVAGLRQHISREELTGRLVALVLNLKPAKLAGELSEAMIMAADHQPEGGDVLVRVLSVPEACQPGDAVFQEGGAAPREYPKECKSKQWKAILEGPLNVAGGVARFKGTPLVTPHGPVTVVAMPDGAGIH